MQHGPVKIRKPGRRGRARAAAAAQKAMRRRAVELRREVEAVACSSTWAEDCMYRGADYGPTFLCQCRICRARFPQRRYPVEARQSRYSGDCQIEGEEDPELVEIFQELRGGGDRAGSVLLMKRER